MTALSYSIKTACAATGFSRSHLIRAIKSGDLRAKKSGKVDADGNATGSLVILAKELDRYLESLEDA